MFNGAAKHLIAEQIQRQTRHKPLRSEHILGMVVLAIVVLGGLILALKSCEPTRPAAAPRSTAVLL